MSKTAPKHLVALAGWLRQGLYVLQSLFARWPENGLFSSL